jgi:hypothetical protein
LFCLGLASPTPKLRKLNILFLFEYVPKVGEFIIATSEFQALPFISGGRRKTITPNVKMKVKEFNKNGDALIISEEYGPFPLTILKRDFNKIKPSRHKSLSMRLESASGYFLNMRSKESNYYYMTSIIL